MRYKIPEFPCPECGNWLFIDRLKVEVSDREVGAAESVTLTPDTILMADAEAKTRVFHPGCLPKGRQDLIREHAILSRENAELRQKIAELERPSGLRTIRDWARIKI